MHDDQGIESQGHRKPAAPVIGARGVSFALMLTTHGRTVMVSGANRGFGNALARRLLATGYNVSCGARNVAALEAVFPSPHDRLLCHYFDATDPKSGDDWIEATVTRFGSLDGLINNAGIANAAGLEDLTDQALDEMWEVNVKAPLRLIRAALPHLRASGSGRVVNLSSLSGLRVKGSFAPGYAMTKYAVTALTEAVKNIGWDDGIRVTALCPSFINTDMVASFGEDPDTMIQPDDLAELVSTVLALPNTASVAQLAVTCRLEPGF
ncbi:MAG: NAD(P)-dependent dehydrogenase (short-subunit alcohol dehydrogenase family) [Thermoproteota archaeon]